MIYGSVRLQQDLVNITATLVSVKLPFYFLYLCNGGSRDRLEYIVNEWNPGTFKKLLVLLISKCLE